MNTAGVQTSYANAFRVAGDEEEIVLFFGLNEKRAEDPEVTVRLANRIAMSPLAAKKLFHGLNAVIQTYESKYGSLDVETEPSARVDAAPGDAEDPDGRTLSAKDKADFLLQTIRSLNIRYSGEQSFKMYENTLLGDRFLLSMSTDSIPHASRKKIMDVCEQLSMPSHFINNFHTNMDLANCIHFGFEQNERSCTYKAYLEFWKEQKDNIGSEPNTPDPFLLYLGYKWDAFYNNRQVLTKYVYHPLLPVESILQRVLKIYGGPTYPFQLVKALLAIASARVSPDNLLYLDVTEDDNPRLSFDINVYRAGLQLAELYPLLSSIGQHYAVSYDHFHRLYEQGKESIFGHLAGGIDRQGRDFLTVYYGTQGSPPKRAWPDRTVESGAALRTLQWDRVFPAKSPHEGFPGSAQPEVEMLLENIRALKVRIGSEYSFKVHERTLLTDRILLGIQKDAIRDEPEERILEVCCKIGMPEDYLMIFKAKLAEATIVLFGFEGGEASSFKAYLEFGRGFRGLAKPTPGVPEPFTIHMGFKWNRSDSSRKNITTYTCFPGLTGEGMLRRLSAGNFFSDEHSACLPIIRNIVRLGGCKVNTREFLYVETREDNSKRSSFDVNMYRANLRVKELYAVLLEIGRLYALPKELYRNAYEAARDYIFGHVSGGTDRHGKDFLTIYFGEKGSSRQHDER